MKPGRELPRPPVLVLEPDGIAVYEAPCTDALPLAPGEQLAATYSPGAGTQLAVPTGRLWVQLVRGVEPCALSDDLESLGLELEATVEYAPGAIWIRARDLNPARALEQIAALAAHPSVEDVEPQLVMRGRPR